MTLDLTHAEATAIARLYRATLIAAEVWPHYGNRDVIALASYLDHVAEELAEREREPDPYLPVVERQTAVMERLLLLSPAPAPVPSSEAAPASPPSLPSPSTE